ncbi:hypothetical protein [Saccharopolyspora hattusasensis]|uniref:hypothetical protein n=1 Tax=Saccharopolyspora hattusasensis TaxID=1128679 RepID=UPI003D96BF5B
MSFIELRVLCDADLRIRSQHVRDLAARTILPHPTDNRRYNDAFEHPPRLKKTHEHFAQLSHEDGQRAGAQEARKHIATELDAALVSVAEGSITYAVFVDRIADIATKLGEN